MLFAWLTFQVDPTTAYAEEREGGAEWPDSFVKIMAISIKHLILGAVCWREVLSSGSRQPAATRGNEISHRDQITPDQIRSNHLSAATANAATYIHGHFGLLWQQLSLHVCRFHCRLVVWPPVATNYVIICKYGINDTPASNLTASFPSSLFDLISSNSREFRYLMTILNITAK